MGEEINLAYRYHGYHPLPKIQEHEILGFIGKEKRLTTTVLPLKSTVKGILSLIVVT